jgi:hypothetical protein
MEFPFAVLALQIAWRKHCDQQARFTEASQDPVTPVVHATDLGGVEEGTQWAARDRFKGPADVGGQVRYAPLGIVTTGVGDEKVVGHKARSVRRQVAAREDVSGSSVRHPWPPIPAGYTSA